MCSTQCTFPGKIITGGKTGRRFTSQRFQAKKSQFGKRDRTAKSVSDRRSAKKRKQTKGERIKKAERTSKNALFPPSADDYGIKRGSKIRLLSVREKESKKNNMIPIVPPQKSFFSFSAAGEKSFRIATMSFFLSFLSCPFGFSTLVASFSLYCMQVSIPFPRQESETFRFPNGFRPKQSAAHYLSWLTPPTTAVSPTASVSIRHEESNGKKIYS